MPTEIERQSELVRTAMKQRLEELLSGKPAFTLRLFHESQAFKAGDETITCAGNQHTCQPQFFLPSLDKRFSLVLKGSGDSDVIGRADGPRALVWKNTHLEGEHPDLGRVTLKLEPTQVHAGTLLPVLADTAFPVLNRNTYHFVFHVPALGEITSDRPAIVEALIDSIPQKGVYVFQNGPVNFHLRGDPDKKTVAILEAAVTEVEPD